MCEVKKEFISTSVFMQSVKFLLFSSLAKLFAHLFFPHVYNLNIIAGAFAVLSVKLT